MTSRLETATFDAFLEASKNKKVILFGAGRYIPVAIDLFNIYGIAVSKIVDNDFWKWGREFCGYKCEAPNCLSEIDNTDAVVLITADSFFKIEQQLKKMGIVDYFAFPLFAEQIYKICGRINMHIPLKG